MELAHLGEYRAADLEEDRAGAAGPIPLEVNPETQTSPGCLAALAPSIQAAVKAVRVNRARFSKHPLPAASRLEPANRKSQNRTVSPGECLLFSMKWNRWSNCHSLSLARIEETCETTEEF